MIVVAILGILLFASGLVIGCLIGLRWCDPEDCSEKDREIEVLISEVNRYKHLVDKVARAYRQKHPEG